MGNGNLEGHVEISVAVLGCTVTWGVTVDWSIDDDFSNPGDVHDDPAVPDKEWKYCTPYSIKGTWSWSDFGYVPVVTRS